MGLAEIIDIEETQTVLDTGELGTEFIVRFTTEETSGSKTVRIPEEEFGPDVARQRARERAKEIDAAFRSE
jgi:hypothetical protein